MSQIRRASATAAEAMHMEVADAQELSVDDGDQPSQALNYDEGENEDLHRTAWQWALANRQPDGGLPPGRVVAEQFARSARLGRWIKRLGHEGKLGPLSPGSDL
ncbi:hypothetical protein GCM10009733_082820 [Nonomuraea maheshkhaliensis]|uniref:Uncharacterized protein n=2 Tax=Nonomuraea maheshkhaliensis TaxID=419590 RepID=A0ABP4SP71_9ACTN